MLRIPLTPEAVQYINYQRVLTKKLNHRDVEWYSFLLFNFISSQIRPYLVPGERILDIGAGLGLVNTFLRDLYTEIWLFDNSVPIDQLSTTYYGFHEQYCFYNSLEVAKELNPDFNITNSLNFPQHHFDVIQSHMSWCWHYPKEMYYQTVLNILKPSGLLIVDVLNEKQYTFPEFELIATLENREDDSSKLILKRKS